MADEIVDENNDDSPEIMIMDISDKQGSKNVSSLKLALPLSAKISESQSPEKSQARIIQLTSEIHIKDLENPAQVSGSSKDKIVIDKGAAMTGLQRKLRSACRTRSRDPIKCQMNFREMIGKHETRNEELEQLEGGLRERLDMLECSMPAVMVWNILRAAQGSPPSTVRRLMEKQFQRVRAAGNVAIPSTPSQHYDCRVREIEAERKEALRRAEEARALLTDKEAAIEERQKRLEEAKKCNQEKKERVEKLNREAAELREATKNARGDDRSCETGECGEIRCKEKLLDKVGSLRSIGSTDLECFAKLQELAESEVCMKRQISELERREEVYMRTLQQADELWSKMEGNNVGTSSELQEQLDLKNAANQQLADRICELEDELEKLKKRLIGCKEDLGKFTSKSYVDAEIGLKDGVASVADRGITAKVVTTTSFVSASPQTVDVASIAHPETMDRESSFAPKSTDKGISVHTKMLDKDSGAIVDQMDREVDRPIGLGIDVGVGDTGVGELDDSANKIGILEESKSRSPHETETEDEEKIPEAWKNHNWDEGCPADIICNDMVDSSTGTDNIQQPKGISTTESKVQASVKMVDQPVGGRKPEDMAEIVHEVKIPLKADIANDRDLSLIAKVIDNPKVTVEATLETNEINLSREELRNWYNIVNSVHHTISYCDNCKSEIDATAQLMEKMRNHLWMKALADEKAPIIGEESAKSLTSIPKIPKEIPRDPGIEPSEYRSSTRLLSTATTKPDEDISRVLKEDMMLSSEKIETIDISIASTTILPEAKPDAAKPPDILDAFPEKVKPQMGTTEEQPGVDRRISPAVLLQVLPQDGIKEVVESLAIETSVDEEKSLAPSVSTEEELSGILPEEQLAVQLSDSKQDLSDIPKDGTIIRVSESPEGFEQSNSISQEVDFISGKSVDKLEQPVTVAETLTKTIEDVTIEEKLEKNNKQIIQDVIEGVFDDIIETRSLPIAKDFPIPIVPMTTEVEYKKPSAIIVSDGEQRETAVPIAEKDEEAAESMIMPEVPEVTPSDITIPEKSAEKLPEKFLAEEKSMEVSAQETVDKSRLSISKVESTEKLPLPESMDPCICKPPTCPPVTAAVIELDSEGTQTLPQIPRTLDRIKLKTITESTWHSPDVVMWRRPLIWSRRRKDKSTLTTVCVDTQTDSALVRERITHQGIDRKDDCTCSGVSPRKTGFGDSYERVSSRHTDEKLPASVSLAAAELFDLPRLRPNTASTEKEISVIKYTGKSSPMENSELHCVECGRPITPEGTSLSLKSSLQTSTKSQKSLMHALKKIATSSASRITRKKDDFTCCECKMLDEAKTEDTSRTRRKPEKSANRKTCDQELCCPCPSRITEKMATDLSKPSRKKRKPEKKDQSVMANIPRSKIKKMPKEKRAVDDPTTSVIIKDSIKKSSNECCGSSKIEPKIISTSSKTVSKTITSSSKKGSTCSKSFVADFWDGTTWTGKSRSKKDEAEKKIVAKVSSTKESSQCGCGEDSSVHAPYTNYSLIFRTNIIKDESPCNCEAGKKKGNVLTCDCSSIGSVSKEESSCNCAHATKL